MLLLWQAVGAETKDSNTAMVTYLILTVSWFLPYILYICHNEALKNVYVKKELHAINTKFIFQSVTTKRPENTDC